MLSVAQSDQSLCCVHKEAMKSSLPNEYTKKTDFYWDDFQA